MRIYYHPNKAARGETINHIKANTNLPYFSELFLDNNHMWYIGFGWALFTTPDPRPPEALRWYGIGFRDDRQVMQEYIRRVAGMRWTFNMGTGSFAQKYQRYTQGQAMIAQAKEHFRVISAEAKLRELAGQIRAQEAELARLKHTRQQPAQAITNAPVADVEDKIRDLQQLGIIKNLNLSGLEQPEPYLTYNTNVIFSQDDRTDLWHEIGDFSIQLFPLRANVLYQNLKRQVSAWTNQMQAPHIKNDGTQCTGNWGEMIHTMLDNMDIPGMVLMSVEFPQHSNTDPNDAAGRWVHRWPVVTDPVAVGLPAYDERQLLALQYHNPKADWSEVENQRRWDVAKYKEALASPPKTAKAPEDFFHFINWYIHNYAGTTTLLEITFNTNIPVHLTVAMPNTGVPQTDYPLNVGEGCIRIPMPKAQKPVLITAYNANHEPLGGLWILEAPPVFTPEHEYTEFTRPNSYLVQPAAAQRSVMFHPDNRTQLPIYEYCFMVGDMDDLENYDEDEDQED